MSLQEKLSYFDERLKLFYPLIGGWPPNLASPEQAQEVRALLEQDLAHAVTLYLEHPQEISAKLVLAELLRMGHNLDVPDCARKADAVLTEIFRLDPSRHRPPPLQWQRLHGLPSRRATPQPRRKRSPGGGFGSRPPQSTTDQSKPTVHQTDRLPLPPISVQCAVVAGFHRAQLERIGSKHDLEQREN